MHGIEKEREKWKMVKGACDFHQRGDLGLERCIYIYIYIKDEFCGWI